MARYVLHYVPDNASLVIRLALSELNVPFDTTLVDRESDEHKSVHYRKLNPNGLIPVLETEEGALFETAAILLWLVDRHGRLGPEPKDPIRGRFLSWLFFVSNTLHPALRMLFYSSSYIGEGNEYQRQLAQVTTTEVERLFGILNAEAGRECGPMHFESVNILNLYIAACLRWARLYPKASEDRARFSSSRWVHLHSLSKKLETRKSVINWCAAESIPPCPFTNPDYPAELKKITF